MKCQGEMMYQGEVKCYGEIKVREAGPAGKEGGRENEKE